MTLQMNRMGLISNGFAMVASYECFKKGEKKFNIECFTDGKEYVVRHWRSGRHSYGFTHVYTNKDEANAKVKQLFSNYSFHKRVY